MIKIEDNDMPVTVAEKIIKGTKTYEPTPFMQKLTEAVTGHVVKEIDMFTVEELEEIAKYLMVYVEAHMNGD